MIYIYKPRSDWHRRFDLTPEEHYDCEWNGEMVYSSDGAYYRLVSDLGKTIEVHETHFIRLDDFRQNKLNDLGI
jgi:hypothetical protein